MTCTIGSPGTTTVIKLDRYVQCSYVLPKGATFVRWAKDGFARIAAGPGYAMFRAIEAGPGSIAIVYQDGSGTHRLTAGYTVKRT